jgi:hypothetical protein
MTARDTYNASIKTASQTKLASVQAAEPVHQVALDAQLSVVGYYAGGVGSSSSLEAAIKTANASKLASIFAAEQKRQSDFDAARETLRGAGDLSPL